MPYTEQLISENGKPRAARTDRLVWDDARVFLAVARAGSLSGAADLLGGGVATMSRRVGRMESALGVPLFVRHQTGYRLTDEGEKLLPKAEALEEAVLSLSAQAHMGMEVAGRVRLATAENLANPVIIPALSPLLERHPRLSVDIVTDVATVNLHRRDADLAVRMVRPERGNVTVRHIGTLGFGLYGSPGYVAARKAGPDAAALDHDRFIGWSEGQSHLPAAQWMERSLRGRQPELTTTTLAGQLSAAKAGLGLAPLPHFLGREAGLIQLPVTLAIDQPIWLVIHADLVASRRVRVVADHLATVIAEQRARLSPSD